MRCLCLVDREHHRMQSFLCCEDLPEAVFRLRTNYMNVALLLVYMLIILVIMVVMYERQVGIQRELSVMENVGA